MFAGLLNKGFRGSAVLLAVLFVLLFAGNMIYQVELENNTFPDIFYNYFNSRLGRRWMIVCLNFLFILIGTILMSFIGARQEVTEKTNYFPVFIYLLLTGISVSPYRIAPQVFANVFILFSIYRLLDTYRQEDALRQIFESALWLSLSFFITVSAIGYLPLFFIALFILRPFYWREWTVAFIGLITPVYIYECMAYLSGFNRWYLAEAIQNYFHFLRLPSLSEYFLALVLCLFLLLLVSLFYSFAGSGSSSVKKQRARNILASYVFFSIFGFFSGGANSGGIVCLFAIPLSFFIGEFFFGIRQIKITNTLLAILILCAVVICMGQLGAI